MKNVLTIVLLAFMPVSYMLAQQADTIDYYDLSLEELMNIQIVSASKKSESLFDAALSASVLTREEIMNAGVTSIPEALRLVPGIIVREQTNGTYDIHIRGLDNVPPNSLILAATNTTTLVMINNRPVYNYMQGGTFWESLPIDLNDVEKIEVVRGPSSTLYGPNAVSGVINIITRKAVKEGISANGTAQFGSMNTSILNSSITYKPNSKFDIGVSGNMQSRGRDVRYFDDATGTWVTSTSDLSIPNPQDFHADPDKALQKYGVNAFANYVASDKVRLSLWTGLQDAEAQNATFDTGPTNLATSATKSKYVDLHASTYGLTTQVWYTTAKQDPSVGMTGSTYDYSVADASVEYELNVSGISIKPGITYRNATYDDSKYWNIAAGEGVLRGERTMETIGGGVRFDTKIAGDKLRLTGGLRMDKFSHPDKWFASYQAAASYKFNQRNLFRLVYSKAYRSPFIFDTFLSYEMMTPVPGPVEMYALTEVTGNKDLSLLSSNMVEFGYRTMPANNVSIDLEGYYTRTNDYSALVLHGTTPTPENFPIVAYTLMRTENVPMYVDQIGASLSVNAVVGKLQLKPFITLQKTTLYDYSPYFTTPDAVPSEQNGFNPANNINSGVGTKQNHKFTPSAYGGAYINYAFSSKLNFNVNVYWFSKQTFYEQSNIKANDGVTGVEHVEGKALVNAKLAYKPVKSLSVFVSGRNLLGEESVEYYRTDATERMVLGGISFDF